MGDLVPEHRIALIVGSTGAPGALREALEGIHAPLALPIIVALHMPGTASRRLAESLDDKLDLPVRPLVVGRRLDPGAVHVAAEGTHVVFGARYLCEPRDDYASSYRPCLDLFLASAAEHHGAGVLAMVLSGLAGDGLDGASAVRSAGGRLLVQDRGSAAAWGMPGAVVRAGLANTIARPRGLGLSMGREVRMPARPADVAAIATS